MFEDSPCAVGEPTGHVRRAQRLREDLQPSDRPALPRKLKVRLRQLMPNTPGWHLEFECPGERVPGVEALVVQVGPAAECDGGVQVELADPGLSLPRPRPSPIDETARR